MCLARLDVEDCSSWQWGQGYRLGSMDGSVDGVGGTGAELSGVVIDGTGVAEESMTQQKGVADE